MLQKTCSAISSYDWRLVNIVLNSSIGNLLINGATCCDDGSASEVDNTCAELITVLEVGNDDCAVAEIAVRSREEVGMSSALEEENGMQVNMQASGMTSWRDCKSDTDESIGGM